MTDAGSTGDDIDKTLDIVDGLINNTDNPKDSSRSKLLNRTVPSASDDIGEAEDLYIGETDEIWEKLDANDLIPILRNKFPKQIADFLNRHNLKNNEGIGGTFAGTFIVPHSLSTIWFYVY